MANCTDKWHCRGKWLIALSLLIAMVTGCTDKQAEETAVQEAGVWGSEEQVPISEEEYEASLATVEVLATNFSLWVTQAHMEYAGVVLENAENGSGNFPTEDQLSDDYFDVLNAAAQAHDMLWETYEALNEPPEQHTDRYQMLGDVITYADNLFHISEPDPEQYDRETYFAAFESNFTYLQSLLNEYIDTYMDYLADLE